MSNIISAFSIPVYQKVVTDDFSILKDYLNYSKQNNVDFAVAEGTTAVTELSPLRLLELPTLRGVKKTLNLHFEYFLKELGLPEQKFKMITSWLSEIRDGGQIHFHNHTNSWFSGVLYFDDDYTDAAPLNLQNPLSNFCFFDIPSPTRWNEKNSHTIIPSPNLLVFFPSYINHQSKIHKGKTRHSLAFNYFPVGSIGMSGLDSHLNTEWLNS